MPAAAVLDSARRITTTQGYAPESDAPAGTVAGGMFYVSSSRRAASIVGGVVLVPVGLAVGAASLLAGPAGAPVAAAGIVVPPAMIIHGGKYNAILVIEAADLDGGASVVRATTVLNGKATPERPLLDAFWTELGADCALAAASSQERQLIPPFIPPPQWALPAEADAAAEQAPVRSAGDSPGPEHAAPTTGMHRLGITDYVPPPPDR